MPAAATAPISTSTPLAPLERIGSTAPIAGLVRRAAAGHRADFEHVVEAARPMLCAVLAQATDRRVWMVCPDIRTQEALHNELLNWVPGALFFPETEQALIEGTLPDPETAAERLDIVQKLAGPDRLVLVLTERSLADPVPAPGELRRLEVRLTRGRELDRAKLVAQLEAAGYEHVPQVSLRGQYAVRGGILDVFSFHHTLPVRVELFGDEIESIRQFDLDAQTSVSHLKECTLLLEDVATGASRTGGTLRDYLKETDVTVSAGGEWSDAKVRLLEGAAPGAPSEEDYAGAFLEHGLGEFEAGDFVVNERRREQFFSQLTQWREGGWSVFLYCNNEGEIERLQDLIPPVENDAIRYLTGTISRGFVFPAGRLAVFCDAELFGRYRNTRARRLALRREREIASRAQIDFSDLVEGEHVVHLEHGIGRYEGMRSIPRGDGPAEEVLVLEFANDSRLYVPLEQAYLVSRYVGIGKRNPQLSELGDSKWHRARKNAEKAVFDYAARLLQVHAQRETLKGFAFPPDNKWLREFEASFLYKETPDQLAAINATKADMESEQPMDRLICGDVGFGKTEVAIRAAFKAVMGGKQVAMLVPTTVLAEQHYRNFRERMSDYPITVSMLSRFRTPAEQRKTLEGLRDGSVDIVIGTHRLISKDIQFKDLGLVVIDEEQRFGVLHKEKFKELFQLVDMLTLSATPIPRTLYLSLMGAKDMSTIETAPPNRIPVETLISGYDERIIRDAIKRELSRQGQVYFLHNRVQSIERVRDRIQMLVPEARLAIGHGQMDEHELEEVMQRFVQGKADVLISTTIIESGLDIPNANTIIIDRADRFGLADLYQLRGRVGRAQHKAYAYLMLPRELMTVGEARKRINAIKQYSSLGAGFKIAMRDLEIRGAGNILGTAQSGHIINIGFDLYCSLLRQAVAQLKGEKVQARVEVVLRLEFVSTSEGADAAAGRAPAYLPISYVSDATARVKAYRRLNEITTQEQLDALRKTWRDQFGKLPPAAENLLLLNELKLAAAARKIVSVEVREEKVMLKRGGDYILLGTKFPRLTAPEPAERLRELLRLVRSL
jgi:transcription-repair coupling factor (superfamily II helicase)